MPGTESKEFLYPSTDGEYLFVGNTLRNDPAEPVFIDDELINPPDNFVYSDKDSGSSPYTAEAVHFSNNLIVNTSPTIANGKLVSGSIWFKIEELLDGDYIYLPFYDAQDTQSTIQIYNDGSMSIYWLSSGANDITGYTNGTGLASGWHHLLYSFDLDNNAGARNYAIYLDDTLVPFIIQSDDGGPVTINFSGEIDFIENFQNTDLEIDISDTWLAPGVSLLTGAGVISEANRRLFISAAGKPVNPFGFPASAILFSGDSSTFPVNQGTGGAFTLTGSLTNASTSPSD